MSCSIFAENFTRLYIGPLPTNCSWFSGA